MTRNFSTIEALRGWMAWWVVIAHAVQVTGAASLLPHPVYGALNSGDSAVRVFIIVSGFVITHLMIARRETYPLYIARRLLRIAPIYLVALGAALLLTELYRQAYVVNPLRSVPLMRADRFLHEQQDLLTYLALHLTLLHGVVPDNWLPYASTAILAPGWSLSLEWQFYLLAPLLVLTVRRGPWLALLVAGLLLAAKAALNHQSVLRWQYEGIFFLAGDLFVIGILCRVGMERLLNRQRAAPWFALAGIALIQTDPKAALVWLLFFALILCEAGLIPQGMWAKLLDRGLVHNGGAIALGRWSYSTYLIHIPVFSLAIGSYVRAVGPAEVTPVALGLIVLASLPVLAAISALLFRCIEAPSIRFGGKRLRTMRAPAPAPIIGGACWPLPAGFPQEGAGR